MVLRPKALPVACGAACLLCYGARTIVTHIDLVPAGSRGVLHLAILLLASAASLRLGFSWWGSDENAVSRNDARLALYFAIAFGLISVVAIPRGSDFWFYIAEGRLAASGANVYTQELTPESKAGLPIVYPQATMMYGPGWVSISERLSVFADRRLSLEIVLYKALMLAAWLLNLTLVYLALGQRSRRHQALGVVIVGWLPLSLIMTLAEGHNDIVMLALVTGWMVSRRPSGGWLLVGSTLIKFASLPLVAIAAFDALIRRSVRGVVVLTSAIILVGILLAIQWNDGALVEGVRIATRYPRFSPAAVVQIAVTNAHLPAYIGAVVTTGWRVVLVAFVAWYAWKHARLRSWTSLCSLAGATILATLLSANSLWPWYVVWILPSLALCLDPPLLKLALPLVVLMPVAQVIYMSEYLPNGVVTALLYIIVGASWLLTFLRTKTTA